jgi:hypothetical protein
MHGAAFANLLFGPNTTQFTLVCRAGNSGTAAVIIDCLSRTAKSDVIRVMNVFCSRKAQTKQSTTYLVAAILK